MTGKTKKKTILKTVSVVDIGCNNCKKPNLSSIFNPFPRKPSLRPRNYTHCHSSSTTTTTTTTNQWFSDTSSSSPFYKNKSTPSTPSATSALAVEKDSDDPYLDFRQSMLHMILENEIYSKDDLRELLHCFLRLNAPFHHAVIVRAFSEICDSVFSRRSVGGGGAGARASRDRYYY
ncbi:PREDICTED: transcription repressor OFP6 [Tarenaya hassleriana]|uniref:transcription repressor OFP6 n=1 Tax=Tarenaya hassleriana TaxID=28532 RepID=UPI00053C6CEF|nr:PREDICTED: transcription repressor OFP6 [Tarenaya hassleriana]